jgi:hypothetical protein
MTANEGLEIWKGQGELHVHTIKYRTIVHILTDLHICCRDHVPRAPGDGGAANLTQLVAQTFRCSAPMLISSQELVASHFDQTWPC